MWSMRGSVRRRINWWTSWTSCTSSTLTVSLMCTIRSSTTAGASRPILVGRRKRRGYCTFWQVIFNIPVTSFLVPALIFDYRYIQYMCFKFGKIENDLTYTFLNSPSKTWYVLNWLFINYNRLPSKLTLLCNKNFNFIFT